jgi:EAL domain-containing protein (putative c-di-GMP-specific phosphodiesterase class I)
MISGILYVFSLLIYGALATGLAYLTHYVVPLFTFTGSLIFGGLFFFVALFLHEMTLYRRHRLQMKMAQSTLVKEHGQLIQRAEDLHHRLLKILQKRGKGENQTLWEKNLKELKGRVSLAPQKALQVLDLYMSALGVLIEQLDQGAGPSTPGGEPFRREPTLTIPTPSSGESPSPSTPHFSPRSQGPAPSFSASIMPFPLRGEASKPPLHTPLEVAAHLHEGVRQDRVEVKTIPVYSLPQRKTLLYQCLPQVRCANGWMMEEEEFRGVAAQEQLNPYIDHMILARAVQLAKTTSYKQPHLRYVCAIALESLQSKDFLSSFVDFAATYPQVASRILFQLPGSIFQTQGESVVPLLQKCTLEGLSFVVDSLPSFSLDVLQGIMDCRPQFLILPARDLLRSLHQDPKGTVITQLHHQLETRGIDLIVSHIEDEATLLTLLDLGIGYGAGETFMPAPLLRRDA